MPLLLEGGDPFSPSEGEAIEKSCIVINNERKLSQTCGVFFLYARDEKGKLHCADGCNHGKLGYGAHGVLGGRATGNPE